MTVLPFPAQLVCLRRLLCRGLPRDAPDALLDLPAFQCAPLLLLLAMPACSRDAFALRARGVCNRANAYACPAPGKSVDEELRMATLESFLNNRTAKEESKPMNFGIRGYLAPSALADRISDASVNLSTLKQGILGGMGRTLAPRARKSPSWRVRCTCCTPPSGALNPAH